MGWPPGEAAPADPAGAHVCGVQAHAQGGAGLGHQQADRLSPHQQGALNTAQVDAAQNGHQHACR